MNTTAKNGAKSLLLVLLIMLNINTSGQTVQVPLSEDSTIINKTSTGIMHVESKGLIKSQPSNQTDWFVTIKSSIHKHYGPNGDSVDVLKARALAKQKEQPSSTKASQQTKMNKALVDPPTIGSNFSGNMFDGSNPLDNSIAVSNDGMIVSATNGTIRFYDTLGTLLYNNSFINWIGDFALVDPYDPRVIYDSEADRFIFVVLDDVDFVPSSSKVIILFSKTNDPRGGWWRADLDGPFNSNTWADFPNIAVSDKDLFISANLYTGLPSPAFSHAIIFQIDKQLGYSGAALDYREWNITLDGAGNPNAYGLAPAPYGHQGNYGPGMYFVNTWPQGANYLSIYRITSSLNGTPFLISNAINVTPFGVAASAAQLGTTKRLNTGLCHILSAFYLKGIVHCVLSGDVNTSSYSGINYYRINTITKTIAKASLTRIGYNYAYPSIASFSSSTSDKSVVISFVNSGSAIYPELRAVTCDDNMNFSNSVLIKAGEDNVNIYAQPDQWGDYTTIVRKHSSSYPTAWLAGGYGYFGNVDNTWISELKGSLSTVDVKDNPELSKASVKVYPNPIIETFKIEFEMPQTEKVDIRITNINGSLVKILYQAIAVKGKNTLSFNKKALESGIYFLSINSSEQIIKNEKIVIAE